MSLETEIDRAYQMLEIYGVPRDRAKSICNGIDVLGTRFEKEINILNHEIYDLRKKLEQYDG